MSLGSIVISILGLCVFEVVSSLDNAVVNADVLSTMDKKWRKWFLVWGLFFSVFLIRGLLPWLIVWLSNPSLGALGALSASFSNDPHVKESIEQSAPILMMGGSIFLIFLFLHWLFLEPKEFGLSFERFMNRQGAWFLVTVSVILSIIICFALKKNTLMALAAFVGALVFFITHGFKIYAERMELQMKNHNKNLSDISKLMYLEVLGSTFTIDGVIGVFAFTSSVPLIILGNGLGSIVVRELTIRGVDKIKDYVYLKNGAMYSIFVLGVIMLCESFGAHIHYSVAPLATFFVIGYFVFRSVEVLKQK